MDKILQRKVAEAQRRKAAKHFCFLLSKFLLFSLRLCAFALNPQSVPMGRDNPKRRGNPAFDAPPSDFTFITIGFPI